MIIRVLCLDDDVGFTTDLRTNISALDADFYVPLGTNITGIDVVTASEPEEAFKIINNPKEKIVLMIIDIELKYGKQGHLEYDRLFYEGKAIPAIVVSAYANTPKRRDEIHSMGISVIIDKLPTENLSGEIARKICEVLGSRTERILQLRAAVERLRIHNNSVSVKGDTKTIQEWFKIIVAGELDSDKEAMAKQEITNECARAFRKEADHRKGFKRED
jgi:hypothetical protein